MRTEFWVGTYAKRGEEAILRVRCDFAAGTMTVGGAEEEPHSGEASRADGMTRKERAPRADGAAQGRMVYCGIENPSYLLCHPNGRVLYAVEERNPDGGVCALAVEKNGRLLQLLDTLPTGGADPCHLSLDAQNEFLFAANYTSGSLAVFRLDKEGRILERTQVLEHRQEAAVPPVSECVSKSSAGDFAAARTEASAEPRAGRDPVRQEGPHVHFSVWHDGELYVVDLGLDTVFRYALDRTSGRLTPCGAPLVLPAGRGPRHLAFAPGRPERLYVLCELSSSVFFCERERENYRSVQEISALPERETGGECSCGKDAADNAGTQTDGRAVGSGEWAANGQSAANVVKSTAAAIHFFADGRFLFTSNRGDDSIAVFRVQEDGRLEKTDCAPTGGTVPRDFGVFGEYLAAANQDSHALTALRFDETAGRLVRIEGMELATQGRPVCIAPVR